ncbi:MAG: phosphatase PAP2 family protein [Acidobacteriota bacterium]
MGTPAPRSRRVAALVSPLPELLLGGLWLLVTLPALHPFDALLAPLGLLLAALAFAAHWVPDRLRAHWRAGLLFLSFALGHSLIGALAKTLGHPSVETVLALWDDTLFGSSPVLAAQSLALPGFSDVLQVAYAAFVLLAFPLPVLLFVQRRREELMLHLGVLTLAVTCVYAGYFLSPATTPARMVAALGERAPWQFEAPLPLTDFGLWVRSGIDALTFNHHDAFPSGHVAVTVFVLAQSWRLHRKLAWCLLPIGVLGLLATLVLRYHFAIDLIVGGLLGGVLCELGAPPRTTSVSDDQSS